MISLQVTYFFKKLLFSTIIIIPELSRPLKIHSPQDILSHLWYLYLLLDVERRGVHGTAVAATIAAVYRHVAAVVMSLSTSKPRVAGEDLALPDDLQLPRPVALVHRTELVPPAPHPVVPHRCKRQD